MRHAGAGVGLLLLLSVLFPGGDAAARAVVAWKFDYVNVRAEPSTAGEPVGRLAAGAEADVLEAQGEWSRVRFSGGEGWVVSRSLHPLPAATMPPAAPAPRPEPPAPPPTALSPAAAVAPAPPAAVPVPRETPAAVPPAEQPGGYLSQYNDTPALPRLDTGSGVLRALSGLLIVLALIAGAVLVARKVLGARFPAARRPGGIRVLGSRPVAQRQSLLLVEVEGLVWLVGQGPEGLRLIAPVEDERALARLDDRYEFRETPFQSELRHTLTLPDDAPAAVSGSAAAEPSAPAEPTREQRLAALRRRSKPGEDA